MDKYAINGRTELYGLIGEHIEHSFSPLIYNFLFDYYGLNKVYAAFNVTHHMEDVAHGIKGLGIKGINVTAPYKEDIAQHIDCISKRAQYLGTVNTVKNINGKLYGFNTDYFGIIKAFKTNNINLKHKKTLVFGGGAIARTIVNVLECFEVDSIVILNRTLEKAQSKIKAIKNKRDFLNYGELNNENINNTLNNVDIIINATSIDLFEGKKYYIDWKRVKKKAVFFDVLYNPDTKLILQAADAGFKVIRGAEMLIWQGLKAFQIWTGIYPEKDLEMYTLIINHIYNKKNKKNDKKTCNWKML